MAMRCLGVRTILSIWALIWISDSVRALTGPNCLTNKSWKCHRLGAMKAGSNPKFASNGQTTSLLRSAHLPDSNLERVKIFAFVLGGTSLFLGLGNKATASVGAIKTIASASAVNKPYMMTPVQGALLWLVLFSLSAILHGAESAITKISPWKVKQFAEEEGKGSPFSTLSANITRLLSTILVTTTACSIYSTALFVETATRIFPQMYVNMGYVVRLSYYYSSVLLLYFAITAGVLESCNLSIIHYTIISITHNQQTNISIIFL